LRLESVVGARFRYGTGTFKVGLTRELEERVVRSWTRFAPVAALPRSTGVTRSCSAV